MTHKCRVTCVLTWGILMALCGGLVYSVQAQPQYEIAIQDIEYLKVHKNWLSIPSSVDLKLSWSLVAKEVVDDKERVLYGDTEKLALTYQVYMYKDGGDDEPLIREVRRADYTEFLNMPIGDKLQFKVRAYSSNSILVAESAPASVLIGRDTSGRFSELAGKTWLYYLHPGRWQLGMVGKADIYDAATSLGQIAFIFLSVTSGFCLFVMVFYSSRTLYLGNVFPFGRSTRNWLWSFSLSCDRTYEYRLTSKFKFILKAWANTATKSRQVVDAAAKNIPDNLSATEKMASVDVACMEYWTTTGDRAIGTIEDIIKFPGENGTNGNVQRNPDDVLTELVIKIEDSFHDLIATNGDARTNGQSNGHAKSDMKKLIDEIYEPVIIDEKPASKVRKWLLRKGVFDLKKGLEPFPTSRIIHSGLEIHRMNGYRWLKPAEEVKRAFESRASMEIDNLSRKSKIEWFWNYGALAPLVGLFGTVTGITYAFQQLSSSSASPDFVATIQQLSNGIFEALWTTIFGLANGIVFIIVYYYFKHKLDWIYAKWEEIYVSITEKV